MLIALLILLGVNLVVIVAFVTIVVGRRRWLNRQPGAFSGAIRVTRGELGGVSPAWKRGTARFVRDVLVWSKAPFMFRTELIPIDRISGERQAARGELKRLGDHPHVAEVSCGEITIELAANGNQRHLLTGPFTSDGSPAGC